MHRSSFLLAVTYCTPAAFGGLVTFSPDPAFVSPTTTPQVEIAVSVTPTEANSMVSLDMVIGSYDIDIVSFEYSPLFNFDSIFKVEPQDFGYYPHDIYVGGFLSTPQSSVFVGTLTVNLEGLPPGLYELVVSTESDGFSGIADPLGNPEPLTGYGRIIIPEPRGLLLLTLAALFTNCNGGRRKPTFAPCPRESDQMIRTVSYATTTS